MGALNDLGERREEFMRELSLLTQKYGIKVVGCGEFGCPELEELSLRDAAPGYGYVCRHDGMELDYTARS